MIGFVGGIELPPIEAAYQGWVSGARAVNPKVRTRKVYLNSFDDVAAGREATLALMRAGADMFHHNADAAALGLFQAVKETPGVYVFGANADQAQSRARAGARFRDDRPSPRLPPGRARGQGGTLHAEGRVLRAQEWRGALRGEPGPRASIPAALKARVRAAAESIAAGTLIAAPRPPRCRRSSRHTGHAAARPGRLT